MKKRVVAVLVGTLLAVSAVTIVPPAVTEKLEAPRWPPPTPEPEPEVGPLELFFPADLQFEAIWRLEDQGSVTLQSPGFVSLGSSEPAGEKVLYFSSLQVHWPLLVLEQALVIFLGGGLLCVVVRRERRRRASSAQA